MSSQTVVDVVISGTTATVVDAQVDGITTVAGAPQVTNVSGQIPDLGVTTSYLAGQGEILSLTNDIANLRANVIITGQTLTDEIGVLSGVLISTGNYLESNILTLSGNLIASGNHLDSLRDILSGNLISSGNNLDSLRDILSGNLIVTGRVLEEQIQDSDIDISSLQTATGELQDKKFDKTGGALSGNITPSSSGTLSLGTADFPFKSGFFEDLTVSNNTLYVGEIAITATDAGGLDFESASGTTFFKDVSIRNLTVTGTETIIDVDNLAIKDNKIILNSGESGAGISLVTGGIIIDRGTLTDADLLFNEANKRFEFNFPLALEGNLAVTANQTGTYADAGNLITTGQTLTSEIGTVSGLIINNDGDITSLKTATGVLKTFTDDNAANLITTGQTLTTNINTVSTNLVSTGSVVDDVSGNLITTGQTLTSEIGTVSGLITDNDGDITALKTATGVLKTSTDTNASNLISTGGFLESEISIVSGIAGGQDLADISGNLITTGQTLQVQITSNDSDISTLTSNLVTTGQTLTSEIATVSGIAESHTDVTALSGKVDDISGNLITTGQTLQTQITSNDGDISTLTSNLITTGQTLTSEIIIVSGLTTGSASDPALSGKVDTLSGNLITTGQTLTTDINAVSSNLTTTGQTLQTQITSNDTDISNLTSNVITTGQTLTSEIAIVSGIAESHTDVTALSGKVDDISGNLITTGQTLQTQITSNDGDITTLTSNLITTGQTLTSEIAIVSGIATGGSAEDFAALSGDLITTGQTLQTQITSNDSDISALTSNLITTGQTLTTDINTVSTSLISTGAVVDDISGNLITTGQTLQTQITSNDSDISTLTSNLISTGSVVDDVSGNLITTGQTLTTSINANSSNLITTGQTLTSEIAIVSGIAEAHTDVSALSGKVDGISGNLITTGQTLTTNINTVSTNLITTGQTLTTSIDAVSSNLVSTGTIVDDISGNLITTGQTLQTQITSNDSDITNLTTNLITTGQTLTSEIGTVSGLITDNDAEIAALLLATGELKTNTNTNASNLVTTGQTLTSEIAIVSGIAGAHTDVSALSGKVDDISGNLITTGQTLQTQITSNDTDISNLTANLISTGSIVDDVSGNLITTGQTLQTQITSNDSDISTLTSNLISTGSVVDDISGNLITTGQTLQTQITSNDGDITNLTSNLVTTGQTLTTEITTVSGLITDNDGDITALKAATGVLKTSTDNNTANLISTGAIVDDISGNLITSGQTLQTQITSNDSDISTLTSNVITTGQTLQTQITSNDSDISTLTSNLVTTGQTLTTNINTVSSNLVSTGSIVDDISGNLITTGQTLQAQITSNDGDITSLTSNLVTTGQTLQTQVTSNDADIATLDSTTVKLTTNQSVAGNKIFTDTVTVNNLTVTGTEVIVDVENLAVRDNIIHINSGESGAGISRISGGITIDRGTETAANILYNDANDRFELNFPLATEGNVVASAANLITTGQTLTTNTNTVSTNLVSTGSVVDDISGNLITTGQTLQTQITSNDSDISTLTSNLSTTNSNLVTTGQTLQTQITSNDTDITNLSSNLVTTGQTLTTNINTVATNLVTTGQTLTSEIATVSGLIPATVIDGGGTANKVPLWSDANTIGDSVISQSSSKIGIGTATPSAPLHVAVDGTAEILLERTTALSGMPSQIRIKSVGSEWSLANNLAGNGKLSIRDVTDSRHVMVFDGEGVVTTNKLEPLNGNDSGYLGSSSKKWKQVYFGILEADTATFSGAVTANAGINIDNINIDGTTIALSSGDLTLDVAANIELDANGGQFIFKDNGTSIGRIENTSSDFVIKSMVNDKDIIFKGEDGGSDVVALTLNMSEAGEATFNSDVFLKDNKNVRWGDGQDFRISFDGSNAIIYNAATNSDVYFKGNNGSQFTALTLDMSDAGTAIFNHDITLPDSGRAVFGGGSDLQIYHDGSNSYINDTGTGALFLKTNYLAVAGANGNQLINAEQGAAVELYHNNSKKLSTDAAGVSVVGNIYTDGNVNLTADNKKIRIGAGEDLQLYHDGSHSYIDDAGTGGLYLRSNDFRVYNAAGSERMIQADDDGAVVLYHNALTKLATASTGVNITGGLNVGTVTSTGNLSMATDNATIYLGAGLDLRIYHDGSNSVIKDSGTGNLNINATNLALNNAAYTKTYLLATDGGSVQIRHNDSIKFETTSTGVTVTGAFKTTTILDTNNSAGTSGQILTSTGSALDWKTLGEISGVDGTGTAGYLSKWTDADTIGNSVIVESSSKIGIGTTTPAEILEVVSDSDPTILIRPVTVDSANSGKISYRENAGGTTGVDLRYDGANNRFSIDTSDVANAFVVKRTDGNVGIGTTAPAYTLDVQGNIGRNSTGTLVIQGGNSASNDYTQTNLVEISASSINPNQPNHGGNARVASIQLLHHDLAGSASSGSIKFYTQATNNVSPYLEERMVIKPDGNVGIGTAAPATLLHVYNNTALTPSELRIENATAGYNAALQIKTTASIWDVGSNITAAAGSFEVYERTSGSTGNRLTIRSGGSVGIGTTAPAQVLHVAGGNLSTIRNNLFGITSNTPAAGGETNAYHNAYYDTTNSREEYLVADEACKIQFVNGQINFRTAAAGSADGAITWVNAMGILADGKVGIGTAAPTRLLTLENNTGTVVNQSQLRINNAGAGDAYVYMYAGADWSFGIDNSDADKFKFNTSNDVSDGTEVLTLQRDGNVGIGTTAPSAMLDVVTSASSTVYAAEITQSNTSNGDGLYVNIGSTSASDYVATFRSSNNNLFDIKGNGNVGIGIASPTQLFHVKKTGGVCEPLFQSSDNRVGLQLKAGAGGDANWILYSGYPAAGDFTIREGGVANHVVVKKTTGRVGIGTTAPGAPLEVVGGSTNNNDTANVLALTGSEHVRAIIDTSSTGGHQASLVLESNSNEVSIATTGSNEMRFNAGGSERVRIISDGKVGIGTTGPYYDLDVRFTNNDTSFSGGGSGNWGGGGLRLQNASTQVGAMSLIQFRTSTAEWFIGNKFIQSSPDRSDFIFSHEDSEKVRFKYDGKVGIGTTPSYKFEVVTGENEVGFEYDTHANGTQTIKFNPSGAKAGGTSKIYSSYAGTGATEGKLALGTYSSQTALVIQSDGNIGIGTTVPSADLQVSTTSGGELLVTRAGNSGVTLQQVNGGAATSGSLAIKAGTAISFSTNGTNQGLYINNQTYPRVGIGTSSFRSIGGLNPQLLNIEGVNSQWDSGLTIVSNATGDYEAACLVLGRTGGTTAGSNTIVTDNDVLGRIIFTAADGVDMRVTPAEIRSSVDDSSPAADSIKGNLEFYTNDGSSVAPTVRFSIAPAGAVTFNSAFTFPTADGSAGQVLQTNGSGTVTWSTVTGGGGVSGSGTDNYIPRWNGTTALQNSAIFSDDNDNVGIGTTAPTQMLEVRGTSAAIRIHDTWSNVNQSLLLLGSDLHASNTKDSWIKFFGGAATNDRTWSIGHNGNAMFRFNYLGTRATAPTGGTTVLNLDGINNRVGIGTTAPNFALQVDEGTTATYAASIRNAADNLQLKLGTTTGALLNIQGSIISTGAAYNISLQADGGNVGIGTTAPGAALDVRTTTVGGGIFDIQEAATAITSGYKALSLSNSNATAGNHTAINFSDTVGGSSTAIISAKCNDHTNNYGDLQFWTRGSGSYGIRMHIDQEGQIGVGNTDPAAPLTVTADSGANAFALRARSADDYSFIQFFNNAGSALRGQIYSKSTGDIGFTTGTDSSAGNDLYIKNGTGVGIGIAAPEAPLHVGDGTNSNNFITAQSSAGSYCGIKLARGNGGFSSDSHNNFGLLVTDYGISISKFTSPGANATGRADYLTVKDGGNVGIGTTAPGAKLHTVGDQIIQSSLTSNIRDGSWHRGLEITTEGANYASLYFGNQQTTKYSGIIWTSSTSGNTGNKRGAQIYAQPTSAANTDIRFDTNNAVGTSGPSTKMIIRGDGKVGIGTTAPDGLLHVTNTTYIDATTNTGTSSALIWRRLDKTIVGRIVSDTTNLKTQFWDNNSAVLTIGSDQVGIGTTAPLSKFNVKGTQGNWRVDPDSVSSEIQVLSTTVANDGFRSFRLRTNETIFDTGGTERMRIKSDGKVGIGYDSPECLLDLKKSLDAPLRINLHNQSTNAAADATISFETNGQIDWGMGIDRTDGHFKIGRANTLGTNTVVQLNGSGTISAPSVFIDAADGKVGIGTTAPAKTLELSNGTSNVAALRVARSTSLSDTYTELGTVGGSGRLEAFKGNVRIGADPDNNTSDSTIEFLTDNSVKMAIKSDGKVGIGTTNPSRKLTVEGGSGDNLPVRIIGGASTTKSSLEFQDPTTTADYKVTLGSVGDNMFFQAGGSERIRILADGKVGIGITAPTAFLHVYGSEASQWAAYFENVSSQSWGLLVRGGADSADYSFLVRDYNQNDLFTIRGNGNVGIGTNGPDAPLHVARASDYKVIKLGDDITSHYVLNGNADHTLTLTCPSYFQAEIVITANQTNGGTYNNLYIRGIWSNNHTSHHWDEIENIGSLSGSTFTITVGQNGGTTNSGEWKIVHDYVNGSFDGMTVRITDFYGTHAYTIS